MIKKVIESIFGSLEKDVEKVLDIEKSIQDNKLKAVELSQEFNPIIKRLERDFNIYTYYCNIKKGEERDDGLITLNRLNDKLKKAKSEYFKELSELRKSNIKLNDKLQDLLSKDQVKELVEKTKKKDSIDKIIKSLNEGVLEYDKLEKAHKYIRREGVKGNYKYIYREGEKKERKKEENVIGDKKENNVDYKLSRDHEYFVRYSDYIQEDLKRGWSSWNFGVNGFEGSSGDLLKYINETKEKGGEISISGFDIWVDDKTKLIYDKNVIYLDNYEFRELYPNYWVVVDNVNAENGLSAHQIPNDKLDEMKDVRDILEFINKNKNEYDGTGEGESFDATKAKVVYSKGNLHIIEIGNNNNVQKSIVTIINAYLDDKVNSDVLEKAAKGQDKVAKVMREFKAGKLKDSHGNKVTDREQALAIAISEAGLNKSEENNKEEKSRPQTDTKEFLEEMIKEHERLIGILKPHVEVDEKVKNEIFIQEKELKEYKEELEDLKKKGDNEDEKIQKSIEKIEDLFNKGIIPEDILIKARSGKYADNPVNRRLNRVGQPYGSKKQEDALKQPKTGKKEDEKKDSEPKDLEEQAKQTSGSALEQAAKEAKDPEVRAAAYKELDRREKEESVDKSTKTEENVTSKNKEEDNQLRKNLLKYYFGSEYGDIRAKTASSMKYKNLGDITLRISDHSANAKNQSLNEVSIVTFRDDATEDKFISATNTNVGGKSLEDSISIINNELKKELKKYIDDTKVNDANDLDNFFKTVQEVSNEVGMDNNEVSKLIKNKLDGLDIEDTNVFDVEDLLDNYSDLYNGSININVKKRDSDSGKVDENVDDNKERQLNKIKSRLKKEGISENEEKLAKDIFMNSSPKVGEPIKSEMVLNILASNIYKEKDKK